MKRGLIDGSFSFAVNQILSDQSREEIVGRIHENLQEIGNKARDGSYEVGMFEIRKVSEGAVCQRAYSLHADKPMLCQH